MQSVSTRPAVAGRVRRARFVFKAAVPLVAPLVMAASLLTPTVARTAEYSVTPEAVFLLSFSDNRSFAREGVDVEFDSKTALSSTFRSTFKAATERTELTVAPYVRLRRFSGNRRANSDDQGVVGSLTRNGERTRLELPFSVLRDSTSSNEFIEDDTDGRATERVIVRRLQVSVSPTLTWAATERLTLSLTPAVRDTSFDGGDTIFDFRTASLQGVGSYQLNERTAVLGAVSVSHLESPDAPRDPSSTTVGATVGAEHQLSPTLTVSGTAGILSTDRERIIDQAGIGPRESDTDSGPQGRLTLTKTLERTDLTASVSRSRSPTITGTLVENDRVEASLRHRLSERLIATTRASYNRRSAVGFDSDESSQNVDQLDLGLTVRYRLTDRMDVSGAYRFALSRDREDDERAERNTLFFTLRVGGPTYAISR